MNLVCYWARDRGSGWRGVTQVLDALPSIGQQQAGQFSDGRSRSRRSRRSRRSGLAVMTTERHGIVGRVAGRDGELRVLAAAIAPGDGRHVQIIG